MQIRKWPAPYASDKTNYHERDFSPAVRRVCAAQPLLPRISKVIVLGDVAVGKTSLVNRWVRTHVYQALSDGYVIFHQRGSRARARSPSLFKIARAAAGCVGKGSVLFRVLGWKCALCALHHGLAADEGLGISMWLGEWVDFYFSGKRFDDGFRRIIWTGYYILFGIRTWK